MKDRADEGLDRALRAKWAERRELIIRLLKEADPKTAPPAGSRPEAARPITPEQFAILDILAVVGHGLAVKEIAEQIDLPHANITRTLKRLEDKGYVRHSRDKSDRRRVIVRLTLEGGKAARRLAEIKRRLDAKLWGNLSQREQALLLELLNRSGS